MPRTFIAIPLPQDVKERLTALQPSPLPGMRLPGHDDFHITLHFLGEMITPTTDLVKQALARLPMRPFPIALHGVGRFPTEGPPRVLWAGLEPGSSLMALHQMCGLTLAETIRFRPEERPYTPHVTLAWLNEPVAPNIIEGFLDTQRAFRTPAFTVHQICLYTSTLIDDRPHYCLEASFALG